MELAKQAMQETVACTTSLHKDNVVFLPERMAGWSMHHDERAADGPTVAATLGSMGAAGNLCQRSLRVTRTGFPLSRECDSSVTGINI